MSEEKTKKRARERERESERERERGEDGPDGARDGRANVIE